MDRRLRDMTRTVWIRRVSRVEGVYICNSERRILEGGKSRLRNTWTHRERKARQHSTLLIVTSGPCSSIHSHLLALDATLRNTFAAEHRVQ